MAGVGRQGRGGPGNGSDSDESSDLDMPVGRILKRSGTVAGSGAPVVTVAEGRGAASLRQGRGRAGAGTGDVAAGRGRGRGGPLWRGDSSAGWRRRGRGSRGAGGKRHVGAAQVVASLSTKDVVGRGWGGGRGY